MRQLLARWFKKRADKCVARARPLIAGYLPGSFGFEQGEALVECAGIWLRLAVAFGATEEERCQLGVRTPFVLRRRAMALRLENHELRRACMRLCDFIELIGHCRANSERDDYDGTSEEWRDYLESGLLDLLDQARHVLEG